MLVGLSSSCNSVTLSSGAAADGDGGMVPGSCANRAESNPMNSTGVSLILQNFFRTDPVEADSCGDNSDGLFEQLPVCYAASGNRWANFLAVDFYKVRLGNVFLRVGFIRPFWFHEAILAVSLSSKLGD